MSEPLALALFAGIALGLVALVGLVARTERRLADSARR